MASPVPVTYIFCGQDVPSLRERLSDFCASLAEPSALELNTTRFEGKTVTAGEIESAARSAPFLAEMRLVIVDNLTSSANGRAVIDQIPDMLPTLPDWTRLVFVETGPEDDDAGDGKRFAGRPQALKKLINLVENDPRGKVLAFDPPRDLAHWLHEELWEIEPDGDKLEGPDCVVVRRARLVRRIDAWSQGGAARFADACIEHAAAQAGSSDDPAVRGFLDDATLAARGGYIAISAFSAALAVAGLGPAAEREREYRRERAWQADWIARELIER